MLALHLDQPCNIDCIERLWAALLGNQEPIKAREDVLRLHDGADVRLLITFVFPIGIRAHAAPCVWIPRSQTNKAAHEATDRVRFFMRPGRGKKCKRSFAVELFRRGGQKPKFVIRPGTRVWDHVSTSDRDEGIGKNDATARPASDAQFQTPNPAPNVDASPKGLPVRWHSLLRGRFGGCPLLV